MGAPREPTDSEKQDAKEGRGDFYGSGCRDWAEKMTSGEGMRMAAEALEDLVAVKEAAKMVKQSGAQSKGKKSKGEEDSDVDDDDEVLTPFELGSICWMGAGKNRRQVKIQAIEKMKPLKYKVQLGETTRYPLHTQLEFHLTPAQHEDAMRVKEEKRQEKEEADRKAAEARREREEQAQAREKAKRERTEQREQKKREREEREREKREREKRNREKGKREQEEEGEEDEQEDEDGSEEEEQRKKSAKHKSRKHEKRARSPSSSSRKREKREKRARARSPSSSSSSSSRSTPWSVRKRKSDLAALEAVREARLRMEVERDDRKRHEKKHKKKRHK